MDSGQGAPGRSAAERARKMRAKATRLQVSADNYEKGAAGEVAVARVLSDLTDEFVVLHDLDVPGSKANVDHLVIGPTGVFMIDTKRWSGRLTAGDDTLWRGTTPIRRECSTAAWEAQQMSNAVGRPVQPIICFVETALPEAIQQCDGVTVCESDALLFLVRDGTRWLDHESIVAVATVARSLLRSGPEPLAVMAGASETQTIAMPIIPSAAKAAPTAPRRQAKTGSRRSIVARILPPVLAVGVLVAAWALAPSIKKFFADSFSDSAPVGAAPASSASPESAATSPTLGAPATRASAGSRAASLDTTAVGGPAGASTFQPPMISFTCPTPGGGWMATAAPSEFRSDPDGFNMWYRGADGQWVVWGSFKSGISGPAPFGPVAPGTTIMVRLDRGATLEPTDTALTLQATAPTNPC